jgi:hypothetical protein
MFRTSASIFVLVIAALLRHVGPARGVELSMSYRI